MVKVGTNVGGLAAGTIGVFDSGMGGLTVLRALRARMPNESFIYLGDTARLPYGSKTPATVCRYALGASAVLMHRGIRALVVACNTASAVALDALQEEFYPIPVFGVVEPGAAAIAYRLADALVREPKNILVLATESTVAGGAYARALLRRAPRARVFSRACPLLVPLAEAGHHQDAIAESILQLYLNAPAESHAIVLGCTHYPVFEATIRSLVGPDVVIVDSARTTAETVATELAITLADNPAKQGTGVVHFLATDGIERFQRVGAHFLGQKIGDVELVDL